MFEFSPKHIALSRKPIEKMFGLYINVWIVYINVWIVYINVWIVYTNVCWLLRACSRHFHSFCVNCKLSILALGRDWQSSQMFFICGNARFFVNKHWIFLNKKFVILFTQMLSFLSEIYINSLITSDYNLFPLKLESCILNKNLVNLTLLLVVIVLNKCSLLFARIFN